MTDLQSQEEAKERARGKLKDLRFCRFNEYEGQNWEKAMLTALDFFRIRLEQTDPEALLAPDVKGLLVPNDYGAVPGKL